ncbi:MAG: histidine phosphatase family protein [Patescibacteria group bacterium]|nr:histidine phosphatase family protein [Patescibacteria group bacterium]
MVHLYFVRHGLSVMNKKGIFSGRTETPLDSEGEQQAVVAGQQLCDVAIDCIVVSPMQRAVQTAEIIAEQIGYSKHKLITTSLLTERDFGPLEGTEYKPDLGDHEGVETIEDLLTRAQAGYEFLQQLPYDNILVVSHGAIGRALRHCANPSIPFKPSPGFGNAEVVKLI